MCWPSFQAFQHERVKEGQRCFFNLWQQLWAVPRIKQAPEDFGGGMVKPDRTSELALKVPQILQKQQEPEWWSVVCSMVGRKNNNKRKKKTNPTTWDDWKWKGQIRQNCLHRSFWNCSEQDKASLSIRRDTDNAPIEMQNMTSEVHKQEIMDAGTRNGLTSCPLSTVTPRPVSRIKGEQRQREKEPKQPLEAFHTWRCNFQHQSWGFSKRQNSPQCHWVRHRVQDIQLSQGLGGAQTPICDLVCSWHGAEEGGEQLA